MTVAHVDPTTDTRWAALVRSQRASLFHAPPWMASIAATYGFDLHAALLLDDRRDPQAGVAYATLDDDLGRRIVSLPFTDACDPLLNSPADWTVLSEAVQALGLPWSLRCLDTDGVVSRPSFPVTRRAHWHRLDLRASDDEAWAASSGTFRRGVRKARTHGVEVRALSGAGGDDVERFAVLHRRLRRTKYGMLSQPASFFAALRERFAPLGSWHPLGAFHQDHLVAGAVYLRWGDTLYYKFNASDPDALFARPNNALIWAGVELARTLGCRMLDLGPSDDDQPGLVRFKAQTGASAHTLTVRAWTPPGLPDDPAVRRLRVTLGDLTTLLVASGVDEDVESEAGDALYRWFA